MNKITLPGLIDLHVHLRDPGQTHKEDFLTGTSAAVAGGFTTIVDMPNNLKAITTESLLDEKISIAKQKTVCEIGFNFGTLGENTKEFAKIYNKVVGLKVYLNVTTGGFVVDKEKLEKIYIAWETDKPIFLHAEEDVSELVFSILRKYKRKTHICHVSSKAELQWIIKAKNEGLPITCGSTPHHLFLNNLDKERLGVYGHMKPFLKPESDRQFLWDNIDAIDIIETDHAPHTIAEKESDNPPFGVPNLETALPLLLTAESEGRITRDQIILMLNTNPSKIISYTPSSESKIEVDMVEYEIENQGLKTKCGWTPYAGKKVIGKVIKTYVAGNLVYDAGKVIAEPGSGKIIP